MTGSAVEPKLESEIQRRHDSVSGSKEASNNKLKTTLRDLSMNLLCGMSKMKNSTESFKIDVRTEIKDELQEMKEMKKSLKTKVEDGFQNEGFERMKMGDQLAKLKRRHELPEAGWKLRQCCLHRGWPCSGYFCKAASPDNN